MATSIKDRNLFTPDPDPLFSSYLNPPGASPEFPVISEVDDISFGPMEYSPSLVDLTVDTDKVISDQYGTLSISTFKENLKGMSEGQLRNIKWSGQDVPPSFEQAIDEELELRMTPFERDVGRNIPGLSSILHRSGDVVGPTLRNIGQLPYDLGELGTTYFFGEGAEQEDEVQAKLDEMRARHSGKEAQEKKELEATVLISGAAEVPEDFVGPQRGVPTTQWEDTKSYLKERIIKPILKKIGLTPEFGGLGFHPNYEEAEAENMIGGDAPEVDPETGENLSKDWTTTLGPNDSGFPPALKSKDDEQVEIDENGKALDSLSTRDETGIVTDDQTKTISLTGPGIYESLFEREYGFLRPRPLDRSARRSILFQKIGEQMAATGSVAEGFSKGSAAANQEIRKREMEDVEIRNKAAERARDTYEALLAAQAATGGGLDPTDAKSVVAIQQDYGASVQAAVSAQNSIELVDAIVGLIENDLRPTHGGYGVLRRIFGDARKALNIEGDTRLNKMVVLQKMLANIDIQALLAESGKTISDKDRDIAKELLGAKDLFKGAAFQSRKDVLTALDVARSRYDEARRKALGEVKGMELMKKQNPSWGQYLYMDPLLLGKEDVLLDIDGQIIDIRRRPKIY
jgi:hypothetical protein